MRLSEFLTYKMSEILNETNINFHCEELEKPYKYFCASFLTDILKIVNSVKYLNTNLEDFFVQTPVFNIYHCSNTIIVQLFLTNCSFEFRRKLRYKLGHAFETIFSLDHLTMYANHVSFFSIPYFE